MIILNHQGYNRTDPFDDDDTVHGTDFQGTKGTTSFDIGKQPPFDKDFHHPSNTQKNLEESPLVHNAADMGRSNNYRDLGKNHDVSQILTTISPEYAEPYEGDRKPTPIVEKTSPMRYPLEQRIEDKKRGIGRQRYPFVGAFLSAQLARPALKSQFSLGVESSHGCSLYLRVSC
jgi:hypothetical protein